MYTEKGATIRGRFTPDEPTTRRAQTKIASGEKERGKERNEVENGRSRKKEGRCKWVEVVEASGSTLDV
jgi:hypothetical protein